MKRSPFNLFKRISNVSALLRITYEECRESTYFLFLNNDKGIKVFRIQRNLKNDIFCFASLDNE